MISIPDGARALPEETDAAARPGQRRRIHYPSPPEGRRVTPAPDELAALAGGFIHDIKNRLGTLSLNLQLLAEDFEAPASPRERKALERVNKLHGECQKLADLANDFLRFARAQVLNRRPTDLAEVVTRLIDFLTPTARQKGIDLVWYPATDLPPVDLDRDQFEQALLNLLLNAEQAMPDGGTLTLIGRTEESVGVSASESPAPAASEPSTHTRTHTVCLDVIDTGCGMTADVLANLFRPFHTTKRNGTGLGLPTARQVVVAHGGTIEVQSEPGRGTKFTIRLPARTG
ncbi:HAMP domain-containing histidine kinase [bacterium]|nr:HAMP domain-containing histidine kinase [bacterium]